VLIRAFTGIPDSAKKWEIRRRKRYNGGRGPASDGLGGDERKRKA